MINSEPFPNNLRIIVNTYVMPCKGLFKSHMLDEAFNKLLALLEKRGAVPSLSSGGNDKEFLSLYSVRDDLMKIPLSAHTYTVTLNLIKAIILQYTDYDVHLPSAIIAGLAHDIGKIPNLLPPPDDDSDHCSIGVKKVTELLSNVNNVIAIQIIDAIKNHHLNKTPHNDDILTPLLQQADRKAREMELLRLSPNNKIVPMELWLDIEDFYKRLEPHINCLDRSYEWNAITHKGYIYCRPSLIFQIANNICNEKNIIDFNFIDAKEQETALKQVVNHLRSYGVVHDSIMQGKVVRKFKVRTALSGKTFRLIKIKPIGFFNMNELEARKNDLLKIIQNINTC